MTDGEREELISSHIHEHARQGQCFHHSDANRFKKCNCLGILQSDVDEDEDDDNVEVDEHERGRILRHAVAKYVLWWARESRTTQQVMIIAQIQSEKELKKYKLDLPAQNYNLPFQSTGDHATAIVLADVMICQSALMKILRISATAWRTCAIAHRHGTVPKHGQIGKESTRGKIFEERVAPSLKEFFDNELMKRAGPRPTRLSRQIGGVIIRDGDDVKELDPEWTYRRCYGRFLWGQGFSYSTDATGKATIEERTDDDYDFEADRESICAWSTFRAYWLNRYPKLVVRKPGADICGTCYKFQLATKNYSRIQNTIRDEDVCSSDSDEDNSCDDTEEPEGGRRKLLQNRENDVLVLSEHIKEAQSMRDLADKLMADAKESCRKDILGQEAIEDGIFTYVVDYAQNMEKPYFGRDQPGDTYYFTPLTVNVLGIVDTRPAKDTLHAYVYEEDQGHKGGNNVASLLFKHLQDNNLLDGIKRRQLNIIMDNCAGQNKNRMVIRLSVYLLEMYYFEEVQFVFLVAGHTKNCADRLFNLAKARYSKRNIYTLKQLCEAVKHELVVPYAITWRDFQNWDKMFNILYKGSLQAVNKYQIFRCDEDLDDGDLECKTSDLETASTSVDKLKKKGMAVLERVEKLLHLKPEPLYTEKPGLKPIKECELYFKYRPHVPEEFREECCPTPSDEVLETEANRKKEKIAKYKKEKSDKAKKQVSAATVDNISNDRPQELTTEGLEQSGNATSPTSPSKRKRDSDDGDDTEAL
jgi:hypothetical protein